MGEPLRLPDRDRWLRREQVDAEINRVIEVQAILGEHPLLVFRVDGRRFPLGADNRVIDPGAGLRPGTEFRRRDQLLLGAFHQLQELADPFERPLRMEEVRRALRQQDVSHQLPFADFGNDAKGPGDATEPAVFLEEPLGEGMIGENEPLAGWEVVFLLDPIEHLAGGLLGEGQEQDAFRGHALLAQTPVALDQDPRFSGTRPRHDQ